MKNFTKHLLPILCGAATFMTSNMNAFQDNSQDSCNAVEVIASVQGLQSNGNPVIASRSDVNLALHTPDKSNSPTGFYSLGIKGSITLALGGAVYDQPGTDIMIYETSFSGDSCGRSDDETALIELSQDGETWIYYDNVCRDGSIDLDGLGLDYVTQIKITDSTYGSGDGYDLDGVEAVNGCEDIPTDVCYGSGAINYIPGLDSNGNALTVAERMDTNKALGQPEMDDSLNFLSLGYKGEVTITFDGVVFNNEGADIKVVETTFGYDSFTSYPESADVYVSQNGIDFYLIGSVLTADAGDLDISNAPIFLSYITEVKIVDTTPDDSVSDDGFDLDGVIALTGCNEPILPTPAGCYAVDYFNYVEGTKKNGGVIDAIRTETPENTLGEPEGTDEYVFTTLGYGGEITLTFGGAVYNQEGPDLVVVETTFQNTWGCDTYGEYANVYVSADDINYHFAGTVCKSDNTVDISDAGNFNFIYYVKIVNNNELSSTEDAYDLDGVIAIGTCQQFDYQTYADEQYNRLSVTTVDANDLELSTYPNPTSGVSYIEFSPQTASKVVIEVFDINGRNVGQVFNNDAYPGQVYKAEFNTTSLAAGLYVYQITTGNSSITKKFIVSK
ncbi:T9SS type A sorting domain-containing protein [Winogradskyella psychrotolerans]|uniref:T9SS type A sorting domain-containing protein n=1 Tax=Winogradskyella psychrotolerans TaxID=1344585 RepID=UPI001C06849D|nr:T9SS type A sorting domain-containing protein [Winogradskyella psychrotolerans]MBU2927386.1 T9SS type A sorting domain-containing protein [Winogradskyella psychrotolerans]